MIVVIDKIDIQYANKIAQWKSDKKLSTLIMSEYSETSTLEAEKWITKNSADSNQVLNGIFVISDDSKNLVGVSRLMFIDNLSKVCELGIYIGDEKYRGKGLGRTALVLTIRYAFSQMNMRKIFLKVRGTNKRAIELYKKSGFEIEGVLKDHFKDGEKYDDILYMAIFNPNK